MQASKFQSPLHWGIAFNQALHRWDSAPGQVSVPSSLGHRVQLVFCLLFYISFALFQSPLNWVTPFNRLLPSSCTSPLFFPLANDYIILPPFPLSLSFHFTILLFLICKPLSFTPLFIGASLSTAHPAEVRAGPAKFQSPLHWGIAFNSLAACARKAP